MRVLFAAPLLAAALLTAGSAALAADTPATGSTAATGTLPVRSGGIVGFGVMTGTVFQQGQSSFSGIAMRLRVRNASLRPNLEILPSVEYWQNNSRLDAFHIRTSRRDATLGSDVRWVFDSKKGWQPYAGVGAALHFLNDELQSEAGKQTSGVVRGGFDVLGGVEFNLGAKLGSFVELKFHDVSKYRQLKFNTGLGWSF